MFSNKKFIDKTVSLLNEPGLDGNYRSDLIKFLEKLVDDEIKIYILYKG